MAEKLDYQTGVIQVEEFDKAVDALPEPIKPMCTHAGVVSQNECPYCLERDEVDALPEPEREA